MTLEALIELHWLDPAWWRSLKLFRRKNRHHWTQWEEYFEDPIGLAAAFGGPVAMQKRRCLRCGLRQKMIIMSDSDADCNATWIEDIDNVQVEEVVS
jgi:hypothetical protein